jgi:plasmid stabilization system protein ParE
MEARKMDQLELGNLANAPSSVCVELLTMAEQEFAAFFGAVRDLFGPEEAQNWAEEWLHELDAANTLPASAREWRGLSTTVSARLQRLSSKKLRNEDGGIVRIFFQERIALFYHLPKHLRSPIGAKYATGRFIA